VFGVSEVRIMKLVRTFLFWLHLIVGCVAGVVILVMSVTGTILAFERQIRLHPNDGYSRWLKNVFFNSIQVGEKKKNPVD
jgi:hypothetical protein